MTAIQDSSELLNLAALRCAAGTDIGMHRRENQDSFGIIRRPAFHAYFVADGMGGTQGGALASRMAISGLETELQLFSSAPSVPELQNLLSALNKRIYLAAQQDPNLAGMGTTLVGLVFSVDTVIAVHVGDSRAYRVRGDTISQLTEDHTLIKELIKTGSVDPSEEKSHPIAHMLTKSLGPVSHVLADCNQYNNPAQENDTYILCSDGLYNYISTEEILAVVLQNSPDDASKILINLANQRGGADNITVLVISVSSLKPHNTNRRPSRLEEPVSDEDTSQYDYSSNEEGLKQAQIIPPPIQEPVDQRAERRSIRDRRKNSDTRSFRYGTPLLLGFTLFLGLLIGNLGRKINVSSLESDAEKQIDSKSKTTFSEIIAKMTEHSSSSPTKRPQNPPQTSSDLSALSEKLSEIKRLLKLSSPTNSARALESIRSLEEKLRSTNASLTSLDKEIDRASRKLKIWMDKQLLLQVHGEQADSFDHFKALGAYSAVIKQNYNELVELSIQLDAQMDAKAIQPDNQAIESKILEIKAALNAIKKALDNEAKELVRSSMSQTVESLQALQTKRKLLETEASAIDEQINILRLLSANDESKVVLEKLGSNKSTVANSSP